MIAPWLVIMYLWAVSFGLIPLSLVVAFGIGVAKRQWERAGDASWERRMLNREEANQ